MPRINRPVDEATIIRDLIDRVRVLESSARVLSTNDVIPELVPTNGAAVALQDPAVRPVAYDTTARTTAVRVSDSVTVPMPTVVATGAKLLVAYSFRWSGVGTAPPYFSDYFSLNVRCDGVSGGITWFWDTSGYDGVNEQIVDLRVGVFDVASGPHTLAVYWTARANPSAVGPTVQATVTGQSLSVIPLAF